ncbi:MAG: tRNA (adenosine(37)-N6)-threonylcarbamoyltransferase complex ATPase subunit type 1 TsaE [Coprobacillus sp.]
MLTFKTEQEMIDFGEKLATLLFPNAIMTLQGDLGAGKTTFTKGIGKGLGVKKIINSPTFTIVKVYQGRMPLYHFDAYRLEGQDEELGFEEMFEDNGVSVIEWPQYIENILPKERLEIEIKKNEDESRSFYFHAIGNQYETLLKELGL